MRCLSALPTPLLIFLATVTLRPLCAADDTPHVEIETTTAATCSRPTRSGDKISVHYRGRLQSTGEEFDESYKRGKPLQFTLGAGQVIKGWDEGLLDMCPGEARRLTIPPELAYGEFGIPPTIPGHSTLVFETELMDIVGVKQEELTFPATSEAATATEDSFSIATAPPVPPEEDVKAEVDESAPTLQGTPLADSGSVSAAQEGECHLLGPFALVVQGALGAVAILSLVLKRWRETPKRPWKIWFFDVSKQVFGSMLLHVLNIFMSMLGQGELVNAAKKAATTSASNGKPGERMPNPCSFYLLNLGIDTTIGIPVLWLLLKILHVAFSYTPLARPPQSIHSGNYGQPPRTFWWLKQSLIYFIGLTGMKMFVWFLFVLLPWLPWLGDWALRWTEGSEALQIAFTMFLFPLAMNAVQYWVIDNLIKDKQKLNEAGYRQVQGEEDEDDLDRDDADDDETVTEVEESVHGKGSGEESGGAPTLKEVNPTPIPDHDPGRSAEGSRRASPQGGQNGNKVEEDGMRSR